MIVLRILAVPFMVALTLAVAILSFFFSLADWLFGLLSGIFALCALFALFVEGDTAWGIQGLIIAFCVSPFGIPALAEWFLDRLADLNYSLRDFITG